MKKISCAIISSQAFSMLNFRGPLIHDLVAAGVQVHALAPDYDNELRQKIQTLGANPVDFQLTRTGMNPVRAGIAIAGLRNPSIFSRKGRTIAPVKNADA